MPRLIRVFAGRTATLLVLSWGCSNSVVCLSDTGKCYTPHAHPTHPFRMTEPNSPSGQENVKVTTPYRCMGRRLTAATQLQLLWSLNSRLKRGSFGNRVNLQSLKIVDSVWFCSLEILENVTYLTPPSTGFSRILLSNVWINPIAPKYQKM